MIRGGMVSHSLHNDKNSHKRAINLRLVALRGYMTFIGNGKEKKMERSVLIYKV